MLDLQYQDNAQESQLNGSWVCLVSIDVVLILEDAGESMLLCKEALAIGWSIDQRSAFQDDLMD